MPVEWADPPPIPRKGSTEWEAIAAELRSRPGVWALVARAKGPDTATRIKQGVLAAFRPAGTFDAHTRNRADLPGSRCDVYARYVGDEQ